MLPRSRSQKRTLNIIPVSDPSPSGFKIKERPTSVSLTREQAAAYCGFVVVTFDSWVHAGLLPSSDDRTGMWDKTAIDTALARMIKDGHPVQNNNRRNGHPRSFPHVHEVSRKLCDGRVRIHRYHRITRDRLGGSPGNAEFMSALIVAERRLRGMQQPQAVLP